MSVGMEKVRPSNIDELVGMDHIKRILKYEVAGAKLLGDPVGHILLEGPPGVGKTCVSLLLAGMTGGAAHRYLAADISTPEKVYEMAQQVKDGDVIFLEEAHGLSRKVESVLLTWLEEFQLLGGGQYGVVNAPKCIFVLSTTSSGRLSPALRSRCKILTTSYYSVKDIEEILRRAAKKLNINIDGNEKALTMLAQSSRGTPRTAIINRLDPIRKLMAVDQLAFNEGTVKKFFETHDINEWGLEPNDMIYCKALYQKIEDGNGKPVSVKTIAQSTGMADDIITNVIEPYLHQIGVIKIDTRGRSFTDYGYEILGFDPILVKTVHAVRYNTINKDELKNMLESEEVRRAGMKGIAAKLGLRYGPDNYLIQSALASIGYTARQKIGIVKIEE